MKRKFLFLVTLAFALSSCTEEYRMISQPGKKYHYDFTVKNAAGTTNWSVSREISEVAENPKVYSITTTTVINGQSETSVTNDTLKSEMVQPIEEAFASHLAQLGPNYEILGGSKYIKYPLMLKENMVLPSESIRVKANIQGKEVIGEISVKNRTFGPVDTITTPAGTFECLRCTETHTMSFEGLENVLQITHWYGKEAGFIKQHTDATTGTVDVVLTQIECL